MGHRFTIEGPSDDPQHGRDGSPVDTTGIVISFVCRQGKHHQCNGRVVLPRIDKKTGKRFTVCECPVCKHADDRRLLTGSAWRAVRGRKPTP